MGAALANRKHGRLSVNIQCDGDLNYAPAVLWTAAHHRIPLLTVMHNNRAYHQERMFIVDMATRANRDVSRAGIGNDLSNPDIDYASLAKAYGVHGIGPISTPADLGPALEARDRGRETRRAGPRGRGHAAAMSAGDTR